MAGQGRKEKCVLLNLGILVCHRKFCGSLMFKNWLLDIQADGFTFESDLALLWRSYIFEVAARVLLCCGGPTSLK